MPVFQKLVNIFKNPSNKSRSMHLSRNTPTKFESSTAMGKHFRSSTKDLNLGPGELSQIATTFVNSFFGKFFLKYFLV